MRIPRKTAIPRKPHKSKAKSKRTENLMDDILIGEITQLKPY